jgi:hypothetical protein
MSPYISLKIKKRHYEHHMIEAHKYLITWISDDIFLKIVGSAVIILGGSVQCTVEQSFFTKRFRIFRFIKSEITCFERLKRYAMPIVPGVRGT